jgi:type VI protein secretion system component VasF
MGDALKRPFVDNYPMWKVAAGVILLVVLAFWVFEHTNVIRDL